MGRWQGTGTTEQESAGGGGNFTPAPRGFYTIQVADAKIGETKENRLPKVDLTCEIADQGEHFGKKVWLTVTKFPEGEKAYGMYVRNLHAFGLALDGNIDIDPETDFQGRQAKALLGVEERTTTKDKGTPQEKTYVNEVNYVEQLYTEKHPQPETVPPARERKRAEAPAGTTAAGGTAKPSANAQAVFGAGATKKTGVPF